jgi:hypothetical protein
MEKFGKPMLRERGVQATLAHFDSNEKRNHLADVVNGNDDDHEGDYPKNQENDSLNAKFAIKITYLQKIKQHFNNIIHVRLRFILC